MPAEFTHTLKQKSQGEISWSLHLKIEQLEVKLEPLVPQVEGELSEIQFKPAFIPACQFITSN